MVQKLKIPFPKNSQKNFLKIFKKPIDKSKLCAIIQTVIVIITDYEHERRMSMRYSHQRELILEAVKSVKTHPTADMVYDGLRAENPNLSLGTVYRNLNLLYIILHKEFHY